MKKVMPIYAAIIGAIAMIGASAVTAWGTSSAKVSTIDTKVEVVKTTENLHYTEVQRQLEQQTNKIDDVNEKLDAIISAWKIPIKQ